MPFISAVPSFTRHIAAYDDDLLSEEILYGPQHEKEKGKEERERERLLTPNKKDVMSPLSAGKYESPQEKRKRSEASLRNNVEAEDANMDSVLSQSLDGAGAELGSKEMLAKHLQENECCMVWHVSSASAHPVQVVLVWKEFGSRPRALTRSQKLKLGSRPGGLKSKENSAEAYNGLGNEANWDRSNDSNVMVDGIVMEVCKNDADSNQLCYLLQQLLSAMHSQPLPRRLALVTDALRELSTALSLCELLKMVLYCILNCDVLSF